MWMANRLQVQMKCSQHWRSDAPVRMIKIKFNSISMRDIALVGVDVSSS